MAFHARVDKHSRIRFTKTVLSLSLWTVKVLATSLALLLLMIATVDATSTFPTTPSFMMTETSPVETMTLGSPRQGLHLSVGSVDSFLGKKLVDPATSIFVSNAQDEEASENMARYFFFNSNVGSFNTSVSFTIPLFSFTMPDFSGSLLNDLGINTLFSLACLGILFFGGLALLPFIFAYYGAGTLLPFLGGRSMDSSFIGSSWMPNHPYLNYLADSVDTASTAAAVEAAIAKFATLVGDQCAKRTVCEAHSKLDTEEDNLLCSPIRAIFPLPNLETGEYLEDMKLTPLQVAALYGRSKEADCGDQYKLCIFSLLDSSTLVSKYLARAFGEYIRRK